VVSGNAPEADNEPSYGASCPGQPWKDDMATYDSAPADPPVRARHAAPDTGDTPREHATGHSWVIMLIGAIVTFVFGLILVVWPHATLAVIAILLGIQLLVFGLVRLISGFTAAEASGGMRAAYVVLGLLGILAGLYCVRHLSVTVALLAVLVGVFWVLHGIVDLIVAAVAGPVPGRWVKALAGLISLAAGLIVMFKPTESLKFLLVVLGIYLMLYGLLLAFWSFQARRNAAEAATFT
jgi:uncharacterized membrane protein HdeD (DUF308 family)